MMVNEIFESGATIHLHKPYIFREGTTNNVILVSLHARGSYSEAWVSCDVTTGKQMIWYNDSITPMQPIRDER